jgi:DNA-directed RNA polymerase subunit M
MLIPQYKKGRKVGFLSLRCNFCQTTEEAMVDGISYQLKTRIFHKPEEISQVIEEDFSIDPTTRQVCPKCGYLEAYYWQGSNRRKLELESATYYRCIKCKNTWND